ncbi:MAG: guanylate kinase [Desulfobaccales bacterium]
MPGEVFIITAPSGTGKTTLLKELLAGDPCLRFSISFTTRPPRPGEVPGKDYFFVTPEEFARLRDRGDLAEWVEQYGYGYGTSRQRVQETLDLGADVVFDIEPRGAKALKRAFPQGTFIFILPPSWEELERRLKLRGQMEPAELARRLERGRAEVKEVSWYDYLVINDNLKTALSQLRAIVTASRCRTARLWPVLAPQFFPA